MFGQKARDYFQEEKQRVLSCLEKLRAQERVQEVSTNLVLQLVKHLESEESVAGSQRPRPETAMENL